MTAARKLMTADEFLEWRHGREGTWELVNGVPVLKFDNGPRMMAGGTANHALVASNLVSTLRPKLRGSGCVPVGSDLGVRNTAGGIRQPDVTVICGPFGGHDLEAREASAIFEVLSPSTRRYDLVKKADEYRRIVSLKHLVLLEADRPRALVWSREAEDWRLDEIEGLEGSLDLPSIGVSLPMADVYEDVELATVP